MPRKSSQLKNKESTRLVYLETRCAALEKQVAALEAENRSLNKIIAVLPGHIYWKNHRGELLGCNDEQAQAANLQSRHEAKGLRPIDLIRKNQPEVERIKQAKAIEKVDKEIIRKNKILLIEEQAVLEDGSVGHFISKKIPTHDKKGQVTGLVGVTLDITLQKKLEKQLENVNQNKSRFIINIGTLLRNVLSPLLGTVELLQQTPLNKKQSRCVEIVSQSSLNMLTLLRRLYDYVDLVDDNLPVNHNTFILKDFFKALLLEYQPQADEKSVTLLLDYDTRLPKWVKGAKYFLFQALKIFLRNAIKHTIKGSVKLTAKKITPVHKGTFNLMIVIKDTGKGISQSAVCDLFGLFDGGKNGASFFTRAGLNLSIAAKLLQLAHATIEVKSDVDKGTTFTVNVPLRTAKPIEQTNHGLLDSDYLTEEKPFFIRPKDDFIQVLIIDSDPLWQKALKLMLEDAYNCQIDQRYKLKEITPAIKNSYDIIFMDIGSIEGDFLPFAAKYNRKHKSKSAPIIVTTAYASDDQKEKINETKITDIMAKPIGYYDLIKVVDYYVFQAPLQPE